MNLNSLVLIDKYKYQCLWPVFMNMLKSKLGIISSLKWIFKWLTNGDKFSIRDRNDWSLSVDVLADNAVYWGENSYTCCINMEK